MENEIKTIDDYKKGFPKEVQIKLEEIRQVIKKVAPEEATEAISYGMPTFKLDGKNLIHFAAFKSHIGLYPLPEAIKAFEKDLANYVQGKGSIQFSLDKPIPYDLIAQITQYRIEEISKNR